MLTKCWYFTLIHRFGSTRSRFSAEVRAATNPRSRYGYKSLSATEVRIDPMQLFMDLVSSLSTQHSHRRVALQSDMGCLPLTLAARRELSFHNIMSFGGRWAPHTAAHVGGITALPLRCRCAAAARPRALSQRASSVLPQLQCYYSCGHMALIKLCPFT